MGWVMTSLLLALLWPFVLKNQDHNYVNRYLAQNNYQFNSLTYICTSYHCCIFFLKDLFNKVYPYSRPCSRNKFSAFYKKDNIEYTSLFDFYLTASVAQGRAQPGFRGCRVFEKVTQGSPFFARCSSGLSTKFVAKILKTQLLSCVLRNLKTQGARAPKAFWPRSCRCSLSALYHRWLGVRFLSLVNSFLAKELKSRCSFQETHYLLLPMSNY